MKARLSQRVLPLLLLGIATLACALAAATRFGWPAAAAVIGCVSSLGGLTKALIDLLVTLEKYELAGVVPNVLLAWKRRLRATIIAGAISLGVIVGYFFLPRIVDVTTQPKGDVTIAKEVSMTQMAHISWRNIPASEDVRVLVRDEGATESFIERCLAAQFRRGTAECELEIGGKEDIGRSFEIRLVRLPRKISDAFAATSPQSRFLNELPEQIQVLASQVVTRR